jgi:hypothetical protein
MTSSLYSQALETVNEMIDEDGELTLSQLKKLMKGDQGIEGLEGHSPMHVQETKPTFDVQVADMWYKPSTGKLCLFDGDTWEEIAREGIEGLEGERGPKGEKGERGERGPKGEKGEKGTDGKNADLSEARLIAKIASQDAVNVHEKSFDHELIDPFLVGTKKVNESAIDDGKFLQYDKQTDKIVYATVKQVATQVQRIGGGGTTLPSQVGQSGKVLTTNGSQLSWIATSGAVNFADDEVPSGTVNGVNTIFTLAHTPTAGTLLLFLNGVKQKAGVGNHYTISGATITFVTAPETGDDLSAYYRY